RHLGKLKSVPRYAQLILDIEQEHGRFGKFIAQWPVDDITGVWQYLAKHGNQMGGLSAPGFLRMVGKGSFNPTGDVVAA
ncbi:DNA-3-methyladenine glycosylase I, partial [Pseudomonas syringae pv. tagetis]